VFTCGFRNDRKAGVREGSLSASREQLDCLESELVALDRIFAPVPVRMGDWQMIEAVAKVPNERAGTCHPDSYPGRERACLSLPGQRVPALF
jgi:hypothetical protein